MTASLPFLTAFDPPGTGEGSLDPLGLYQIADQLAKQLVPAVRERMQRIRFLTVMAIGAVVTEGLQGDPDEIDAEPYLVWEWLVLEAVVRSKNVNEKVWGIPGTLVTRRAIAQHGYLDARSYLKVPRVFGINGIYKRLAVQVGLLDVNLRPGRNVKRLVDAWARDQGLGGMSDTHSLLAEWTAAVKRSLEQQPPRAKPNWKQANWSQLAAVASPTGFGKREKKVLRELLLESFADSEGALPPLWFLQSKGLDEARLDEDLHVRLAKASPGHTSLLRAIQAYEGFARSLTDAFDIMRADASRVDVVGVELSSVAKNPVFVRLAKGIPKRFKLAATALEAAAMAGVAKSEVFVERFEAFGLESSAFDVALALIAHHEGVQRGKSFDGKRSWFDRVAEHRIHLRQAYRIETPQPAPGRYVHGYRGWPIRRFHGDLT